MQLADPLHPLQRPEVVHDHGDRDEEERHRPHADAWANPGDEAEAGDDQGQAGRRDAQRRLDRALGY